MTHLDQDTILSLKEIMGDEFSDLIETYVRDSQQHLNECLVAMEKQDIEGLQFASHALKGSSANLGATALANLCLEVETATKKGDLSSAIAPLNQLKSLYPDVVQALLQTTK